MSLEAHNEYIILTIEKGILLYTFLLLNTLDVFLPIRIVYTS